jgi:hypothetical protein
LEVALQAKRVVALHKHLLIHRTVHRMARGAAFAHRFVLEHERSALRRVALGAALRFGSVREGTTMRGVAAMRIVAIAATDFAFEHRMVVRQVELAAFVEVTLETRLRRLAGIENRLARPARLVMQAAWSVARLAADLIGIGPGRLQPRMRGQMKIARDLLVALRASGRTDKRGARNCGRNNHRPLHRRAGDD